MFATFIFRCLEFCFFVFFFFKQKTAYELRISDWSSDVCSSDLRQGWGRQLRPLCLPRLRAIVLGMADRGGGRDRLSRRPARQRLNPAAPSRGLFFLGPLTRHGPAAEL